MDLNMEERVAVHRAQAVLVGDVAVVAAIDVFVAACRGGCPPRDAGRAGHLVMGAINGQGCTGPDRSFDEAARELHNELVEHAGWRGLCRCRGRALHGASCRLPEGDGGRSSSTGG